MKKIIATNNKEKLWFLKHKVLTGVLILILILIFANSGGTKNKTTSNTTKTSPTSVPVPTQTEEEIEKEKQLLKTEAVTIPYKELYRNIEQNKGKKVHYKGKVIQVIDDDIIPIMRVDITKGAYGLWEDTVLVKNIDLWLKRTLYNNIGSVKILEDDIIDFWGIVAGETSYEATSGQTISLPSISATIVELSNTVATKPTIYSTPKPTLTPTAIVSKTTPIETTSSSGYQAIYDKYSARLKTECPSLSMTDCAKLSNEGVSEMAQYMYRAKGTDGQYQTYSDWAGKLMDVYTKEAR